MPRLRKLRKKQKYQYNVNRKKLNKKLKKLPRINCDAIRNAWDDRKSLRANLSSMGLVADPNKPAKPVRKSDEDAAQSSVVTVAEQIEKTAREEFVKKKANPHPLPNGLASRLFAMLDKHGEDYDAMASDPTNFYQETAAQFRAQIARLKKVPAQWIPYLEKRGMLTDEDRSKSSSI